MQNKPFSRAIISLLMLLSPNFVSADEAAIKAGEQKSMICTACHGSVIMPEGKSHQDSKLHALRTGAARAALVAAAIANERGNPPPVIQPTGLHWKTHYWFRTGCFVEYPKPIKINLVFINGNTCF